MTTKQLDNNKPALNSMSNTRIAFIGNDCNCTYWYVKLLRQLNINAYLYIAFKKYDRFSRPLIPSMQDDPRAEDATLGNELPGWVRLFNFHSLKGIINICRELNGFNLNIAFGRNPVLIQFCRTPLISFAVGSDLRELVFKINPLSVLYKLALKRSRAVLFDNIDTGTLNSLKKLGIKQYYWIPDYISKDYLLRGINSSSKIDSVLNKFSERFILFSPARLNFAQKGTNILIKGFARFIKNNNGNKAIGRLVMIDYGEDSQKAKELIDKLGVGDHITLLPPMTSLEVHKLIQLSGIVFGYFKFKTFGVHHFPIVLEDALALGAVVISSIDAEAFRVVTGEEPPIFMKAFNEDDVAEKIQEAIDNYQEIKAKSICLGPAWIDKYHSAKYVTEKLKDVIKKYMITQHP